jgi:hypothetical protein
MDFQTKIRIIENARLAYPSFEREFREYTSSGNSFNGAYNFFSLEDVDRHKQQSERELELASWHTLHGGSKDSSPVILAADSIKSQLEDVNDTVSKPAGDKRLPEHKTVKRR